MKTRRSFHTALYGDIRVKIEKAADLVAAAASITANVASDELTPGEASDLAKLVESTARAVEVHEVAERLSRLEEQVAN